MILINDDKRKKKEKKNTKKREKGTLFGMIGVFFFFD